MSFYDGTSMRKEERASEGERGIDTHTGIDIDIYMIDIEI